MAKPIFIAEVPIMQTQDEIANITKILGTKLDDYHVLIVQTNVDYFNFKVFYEKDFTEIELNDLKELIKEKLK